ncbi:RadC family protein [Enterococcus ratti]|uniref:DNA repair protein RadC n=1 Tax=Enterococcus ratti TaxID=150033 RepID=A0A1L8WQC0_9ENTE|nr:DNA repair protein RadC [Enterococcus ratti]OJG83203.1 DNA repair protein RadC [Enterococcus ratti]
MEKRLLNAVPATSLPRERMLLYGEKALSDQELLAILLRTGQHPHNVLEIAGHLLKTFGGLALLRQATLTELEEIRGIGRVKALEIKALIELGKRIQTEHVAINATIHASYELAKQLILELKDCKQEHLVCVYLDTKNQVLLKKTLFIGSLDQTIAHPREVFHYAVRYSAARIILAHNHPSGNVIPSKQDILFTKRVQQCGEMMGIEVVDHLVIGCKQYFSFREEGLMEEVK